MISYELSDPRIGEAVVTEVLVSPDKKHAQVRLHMDPDPAVQQQTIKALDGARNFLKSQLALRLIFSGCRSCTLKRTSSSLQTAECRSC